MKGCMFFDTEFKMVPMPAFYSVDNWDRFMMNVDYIYFDDSTALNEFNELYAKFDGGNTPFVQTGAYAWDTAKEEWTNLWNEYIKIRSLIYKIGAEYSMNSVLALTYTSEVAD